MKTCKITITFSTVTPESAENGEHADAGVFRDLEAYEPRELFDLMRREGFNYPADTSAAPRWISTECATVNYRTGEARELSMHPAADRDSMRIFNAVWRIHAARLAKR